MGDTKQPESVKNAGHNFKILLVASYGPGYGTAHLRRILTLQQNFGSKAAIYAPDEKIIQEAKLLGFNLSDSQIVRELDKSDIWQLIILDNYKTSKEMAYFYMSFGKVVALDEGGEARQFLPYIIDLLPSLEVVGSANESNVGYLELPAYTGEPLNPPKNILVSFGGRDEEHLTEVMGQLLEKYKLKECQWDVVKGPLFNRTFAWPGIKIIESPTVKNILSKYDLVITHFGLTAYEALSSGCNVILFNPTDYHEKLAYAAGFASLGTKKMSDKMEAMLYSYIVKGETHFFQSKVVMGSPSSLVHRLDQLSTMVMTGCPICASPKEQLGRVVYRNQDKSYVECPTCRAIYKQSFTENIIEYNENYFFEDYQKQYGKSYLDDFDHIKEMALPRLQQIKTKCKITNARLLDIGCAYGAFMHAAQEKGYKVIGLDASKAAVEYVKKEHKMQAIQATLPKDNPLAKQQFDIITLWYVIEHFKDFNGVMQQISQMQNKGGILAFSTPKGDGLMASIEPQTFYKESPSDHYVILSVKIVRKIMILYGYKVVAIKTTGVHVERHYPLINQKSLKYRLLTIIYRLMGKGDTFEVYAVKVMDNK